MAEKKIITVLNNEEIKAITPESITEDIITATHYNNIKVLIDLLTAEKKAIENALITKHGNKTYKDTMISISVFDSHIFDTERFISENGEQLYNSYKTKTKHTEKVVKFGK